MLSSGPNNSCRTDAGRDAVAAGTIIYNRAAAVTATVRDSSAWAEACDVCRRRPKVRVSGVPAIYIIARREGGDQTIRCAGIGTLHDK